MSSSSTKAYYKKISKNIEIIDIIQIGRVIKTDIVIMLLHKRKRSPVFIVLGIVRVVLFCQFVTGNTENVIGIDQSLMNVAFRRQWVCRWVVVVGEIDIVGKMVIRQFCHCQ